MRKTYLFTLLLGFLCLSFTACQKAILSDYDETESTKDGVAVRFNVSQLEQMPFDASITSRGTDVKAACSRISLAVYQGLNKINQVNQLSSDTGYGQFSLNLLPGTYRIVILGHNGLKNPTMTDINKITFDGKVTDTFYCCEEITVDGAATHDLALKRAVAMFRLKVLDNIPSAVANMRFYYTGGSSTFDAVSGMGCVNSRQTETREVTSSMQGQPGTFEVYTFPRADSNALTMTVTAMDAGLNTIAEKEFANVPILRNKITQYEGSFFGGSTGTSGGETSAITINLFSEDEWTISTQTY